MYKNSIQFHVSQYKFTPISNSVVPSDCNFQVMPHIFYWTEVIYSLENCSTDKGVAALNRSLAD